MIKMGNNRSYWRIEYLTIKGYSMPCFSPKFYGSYADCKTWIAKQDFLQSFINGRKLTQRITLNY